MDPLTTTPHDNNGLTASHTTGQEPRGPDMAAQEVRMTVQWFVQPARMGVIHAALNALMVATRAEPGCAGCSLQAELGTRAGFTYMEAWKTEQDLRSQLRSPRFAQLAHLMESAVERPRVEFALPGGTRGLEFADEVRKNAGEAS
jgi:quinol monooxygenase YgiN